MKVARWEATAGNDQWTVEIEHDRFDDREPFVVSLYIEGESSAGEAFDALATPTPGQAREMAEALTDYADLAEKANG